VQTESGSDDTLIRYLRGELAEAERDRVEELFFADDQLYGRLQMLESQMIDSYVRGRLPPDQRDRFARLVRNSPEQRRKVEFAEALRRLADRQAIAPSRRPWWESVLGFLQARTPAVRIALAAAAVALLAMPVVYFQHARRANAPVRQAAVPQPRPAPKSPDRTPETPPQRTVPVLAFVLSPLERGGGEENRVVIPAGESTIRLQLNLEDGQIEPLSATIRTADGVPVGEFSGLKPQGAGPGQRAVFVSLPSSRFRDGQYVVRLSHVAAGGSPELVGGYGFRVKRAR
jgi:anti-sigma factor RsiW